MNKTHTIVKGVSWSIIQNVVSILYGIVSVPFLINYFGKEEYGLIGIALSVNVYIQLLDMGMTDANVRFFSEFISRGDKGKVQKLMNFTHFFYLLIGICNTLILFILSLFTENIFDVSPAQSVILRNLLWILALNAIFSWQGACFAQYLQANELIDWIKKRNTFLKLIQFLILVLTIVLEWQIESYFFCITFSLTAILPWTVWKIKKVDPSIKFGASFDKEILKMILPYAMSIFSFGIFQYTTMNLRPLLLGIMNGPSSVADFNVMLTITNVAGLISGCFMAVLLPIVTKMVVSGDKSGINMIANVGTKYANILLSLVVFALIVGMPELLTLYVGNDYTWLSGWLSLWLLTQLLSHRNVMTSLVFTEKKLGVVALMGASAMAVAIGCYFIFIPKFGVGGVVVGFVVHELIHTLFYYIYFLPKRFQINTGRIFIRSVVPSWFVLGIVSSIAIHVGSKLTCGVWWSLLLKEICFGVVGLTLLWLLIFNKADKQFIGKFFKKG